VTSSEEVICSACGESDFERAFRRTEGPEVQQCKKCGLATTVSSRQESLSGDFYGKDYFTRIDGPGDCFFSEFWDKYDEARFNQELDLLERLTSQGNILDVGCATGNFLYYAKRRGWRIYGYDVSEFAVHCTQERTDAIVATGSLGAGTFPEEFFDVVTLHHVLEHVENPKAFLSNEVLPLLRHDGVVLIEVPNFASLEAKVLGGEWEDLRPEQHRWHFTPRSLRLLLESVGTRRLRLYTRHTPLWRIRMLPDYLWMLLALLPFISYRGLTSRSGADIETGYPALRSPDKRSNVRSMLREVARILGIPLMKIIDWTKLGKRLVVVAHKVG